MATESFDIYNGNAKIIIQTKEINKNERQQNKRVIKNLTPNFSR